MKKLFLLTLLCIASLQSTWAKLAITEDSNGTVIFTLEASMTLQMSLRTQLMRLTKRPLLLRHT